MIKIILIGNNKKNYAIVKGTVSELDFLYEEEIIFINYPTLSNSLKEEVVNNDYKKIYIIEIELIEHQKVNLVKFIRDNDWHSEIILIRNGNAILNKNWRGIHRIFDIIDMSKRNEDILRDDLNLIFKHDCKDKIFSFKNRDMDINIYFEKILYVYRDTGERKVVVVTDNNIYTFNMGLKDIFFLLDKRFIQVHRACLVNTMRIEKFDWSNNSFILDNGEEINMLSKHYKDNIADRIKF